MQLSKPVIYRFQITIYFLNIFQGYSYEKKVQLKRSAITERTREDCSRQHKYERIHQLKNNRRTGRAHKTKEGALVRIIFTLLVENLNQVYRHKIPLRYYQED